MLRPLASAASPADAGIEPSPSESPATPRPRAKRHQVARACDACRVLRTNCDDSRPCSSCTARRSYCSNDSASRISTLPHAHREIDRLNQKIKDLEREVKAHHDRTVSTQPPPSTDAAG